MSDLEPFDIIEATYQPLRTDDLKPDGAPPIGYRGLWRCLWLITEEDGGEYVGDYAMTADDWHVGWLWVPSRDLADVIRREHT